LPEAVTGPYANTLVQVFETEDGILAAWSLDQRALTVTYAESLTHEAGARL
jgi:hypothetical protein